MKNMLTGGLALFCLAAGAPAGAQADAVDTSRVLVKRAIAAKLTPEQLQAYKERLARRLAAGAFDHPKAGPSPETPGDACTSATYELGAIPYGPVADTTVGAVDNYDLPPDAVNPTCTAAVTCTGTGAATSLPRGAIYTGTGTGPDRGWRIRTSANCTLGIAMTPTSLVDMSLVLYLGTCSSLLSDCACVSDTGAEGQTESITGFAAVAGTDYFIVVDGYSTGGLPPGSSGPYNLTVTGSGCSLVPVQLEGFSVE